MKLELTLDAEGIDSACDQANAFLSETRLGKREMLAARLSFENILHMWHYHYGDNTPVVIRMGNRFGRPSLVASVRGERFDPRTIDTSRDKYAPIARTMLTASGFLPSYHYRSGYNMVTLTCPRKPLSALVQILIAFVLGVAVSLLGNLLIPEAGRTYAIEKLITPLFDVFLAMLSGIAGPLIFLTVAWGICGIGDVTVLGRSGKSLIGRYLTSNVLATLFSCLICIPLFALPAQGAQGDADFFEDLVKLVIDLLPTNIVKAFVDGNTSQIIILGVIVGVSALVLENVCEGVRRRIEELNMLVQFIMEQFCRFIPAFIFIVVLLQVWSGTFETLFTAWMPILLIVVLIVVFFAMQVVVNCLRYRIPIKKLLTAMKPAMVLGFTTASSCAALGPMISGCQDSLGVDEEQTSFGIPLGMVLCQPSTVIMLVVLSLHCMQVYGLGADVSWYMRMALMCFLYSMVSPPVPGGMLACFGLLFAKLGIPVEALAIATAFNVIIDYVITGFRVGSIMVDVLSAGCSLGSVDRSKFEDA